LGYRYIDTDLCNPDFVKFAESFGAIGFRVENPDDFSSVVAEALRTKRPTIIEIPIPREELVRWVPWLYRTPK